MSGLSESSVEKAKLKLQQLVQSMAEAPLELSVYFVEFKLLDSIVECLSRRDGLACSLEATGRGVVIRACEQATLTKCMQVIQSQFSVYEHVLVTDAGLKLIASAKFRTFLVEKEEEVNRSDECRVEKRLVRTGRLKKLLSYTY